MPSASCEMRNSGTKWYKTLEEGLLPIDSATNIILDLADSQHIVYISSQILQSTNIDSSSLSHELIIVEGVRGYWRDRDQDSDNSTSSDSIQQPPQRLS